MTKRFATAILLAAAVSCSAPSRGDEGRAVQHRTADPTDTPLAHDRGDTALAPVAVEDERLVPLLAFGSRQLLDSLPNGGMQGVFARLYTVPIPGDCVYGGHADCSFQYYLAVQADWEGVPPRLYYLGEVGFLTPIAWLVRQDGQPFTAGRLLVKVQNYPEYVFASDSGRPSPHRIEHESVIYFDAASGEIRIDAPPPNER